MSALRLIKRFCNAEGNEESLIEALTDALAYEEENPGERLPTDIEFRLLQHGVSPIEVQEALWERHRPR